MRSGECPEAIRDKRKEYIWSTNDCINNGVLEIYKAGLLAVEEKSDRVSRR